MTFATRGEEYREKLTPHPRVLRFMETIELELKSTEDEILQEKTVTGRQLRDQIEVGQVLDVIIKVSLEDPLGALYLLGTKIVREGLIIIPFSMLKIINIEASMHRCKKLLTSKPRCIDVKNY